jgi:hypothetical protein
MVPKNAAACIVRLPFSAQPNVTKANRVPSQWPNMQNSAEFNGTYIPHGPCPRWEAASFVQMFSQIIRQIWAVLSVLLKITISDSNNQMVIW